MSLTPNEAADALRDIETTAKRSGEAFGYRMSAPFLMIWGMVWIVGYTGTDITARYAGLVWMCAIVGGTIASALVGRAIGPGRARQGWRYAALTAIIWLFLFGTYAVMGPISGRQQGAFVPLLIAAIYAGFGLWIGARYVVTGIAVAALTLFGFFYVREHFNLYMAAVGGGGLVLVGIWLRSA